MVSAWWLLLAFFVGGYVGILLMALLAMARRSEAGEEAQALAAAGREGAVVQPRADPAVDWVI